MTTEKRMAIMYDGDTTPDLSENPGQPVLWRDTSGGEAVLKVHNKADTAWIAIEADEAVVAKLVALDEAATALSALATNMGTNLDETVAKTDIDDAGTIDGTEIAAVLSAAHVRINAIATQVNAISVQLNTLLTAFKAVGNSL
jgi:hypothetical protein